MAIKKTIQENELLARSRAMEFGYCGFRTCWAVRCSRGFRTKHTTRELADKRMAKVIRAGRPANELRIQHRAYYAEFHELGECPDCGAAS